MIQEIICRQRCRAAFYCAVACINGIVLFIFCCRLPNDEVVHEALLALVALLEGGNQKVQKRIEKYFKSTREDSFFTDMKSQLSVWLSCCDFYAIVVVHFCV